jgi:hypothetical protein
MLRLAEIAACVLYGLLLGASLLVIIELVFA